MYGSAILAAAFLVCTFWYINALAAIGRRDEARVLFEHMLSCRNHHGLLAEHIETIGWFSAAPPDHTGV